MQSDATTVDEYLSELPADRRDVIQAVRHTILSNLPTGFVEGMQYGMISYYIPLEQYPNTVNGQPLGLASLANQKRHMALYLMAVYANPYDTRWFKERWQSTGKRLDMGKSCVRFRKIDDVALDVIGEAIARTSADEFIAAYEDARSHVTST